MSKTKIVKPSSDAMAMMMRRYIMPETGAYETVESTSSRMDYPSAYVIEYRL